MKLKDYYEILGVPRGATQEAIKSAYRKLARKYHPDVSREPLAEIRFKEVGEAYKALKDPDKRQAYDQTLSPPKHGYQKPPSPQARPARGYGYNFNFKEDAPAGKRGEDSFSEILDEMMGHRTSAPPANRGIHVHGSDQYAKVQIDLEDAFRGTTRDVSMPTYVTDEYGMPMVTKRTLKVSIPKGMRAGQTLRLAGQGFAGTGEGKAGDLYLEVVIRPHPRYRVDGRDIYFDIPLSPNAAALGTQVHVATPEGSIKLAIPAGSVAGRKLRLKGKGIPGTPAGDLYAVIVNEAPGMHTVVAQKAYRALKAAFDFSPRANPDR